MLGVDLSPTPDLSTDQIELALERFAGTFPESDRLRMLLNANPLHVDRSGTVSD